MTAERRLLLTNDDGIDAPGLAALETAVVGLGIATVVAPLGAQSGTSHKVTTHAPETFWNVNLPHPRPEVEEIEFVFCPVDPSPLPLSYRVDAGRAEYIGSYPDRPRRPGWDVEVCLGGRAAISLVHVMASVERFEA